MQAIICLKRSQGVPLTAAVVASAEWLEGNLEIDRVDGARCLVLRKLMSPPDRGILASLYQPAVVDASHDHIVLRGIERVTDHEGRTAAVVQEWKVKPRPGMLYSHEP